MHGGVPSAAATAVIALRRRVSEGSAAIALHAGLQLRGGFGRSNRTIRAKSVEAADTLKIALPTV